MPKVGKLIMSHGNFLNMYLNVIVCLLMQGAPKLIQNVLCLILFLNFEPLFYFLNLAFIVILFFSMSWVNAPRLPGN